MGEKSFDLADARSNCSQIVFETKANFPARVLLLVSLELAKLGKFVIPREVPFWHFTVCR